MVHSDFMSCEMPRGSKRRENTDCGISKSVYGVTLLPMYFPGLQGGSILNKNLLRSCARGVKLWQVAVILQWTDFADYLSLLQNDIPVLLLLICHSVSSLILHELTNHSKKLG